MPLLALLGHSGSLWPRAGLGAEGWAWLGASRRRVLQHPDARLGTGVELALASVYRFQAGLPLA